MAGSIDAIASNLAFVVGKVAPILASVLGTPLAGVGISLLAQAFGVDPKQINELADKIHNDPEAAIKLKKIEFEHAEILEKINSESYAIEVDDRKDARKTSVLYKDFMRHMAYLVTAGFFCALILLFMPIEIESGQRELLSMLVGMLVSKWQTIIDFFYGSSRPNNQGGLKNGSNIS